MREAAVGSLPKNRQLEHPQSPERSGVAVGQDWGCLCITSQALRSPASGLPQNWQLYRAANRH